MARIRRIFTDLFFIRAHPWNPCSITILLFTDDTYVPSRLPSPGMPVLICSACFCGMGDWQALFCHFTESIKAKKTSKGHPPLPTYINAITRVMSM
jgi:hypothetical protein